MIKIENQASRGHVHCCPACGTTWAHDPRDACLLCVKRVGKGHFNFITKCSISRETISLAHNNDTKFADQYDASHHCPSCKFYTIDVVKLLSDEKPKFYWDGATLLTWSDYEMSGLQQHQETRGNDNPST